MNMMNESDTNGYLKETIVTSSCSKQDNSMEPEDNKHDNEHVNGKSDTNGNEENTCNIKSQKVEQEGAVENNNINNTCGEDEINMANGTEKLFVKPELFRHMDNTTKWEYAKDRLLNRFDPFHVFQVQCRTCALLSVKVKRGRNISKGSRLQDICDTPDPYIRLNVANSGIRRTEARNDDVNPVWNQSFNFYIAPDSQHKLELDLIDANAVCADTHLGSQSVDLAQIPTDEVVEKTLTFNETSEVDITIKLYKELPKENALRVKVIRGRKITKGSWWKDIRDTPDPFLRLNVPESVSVEKETAHIRNSIDPEWNETHIFYLPPHLHHRLEVKLMDSNWLFSHEKLGVEIFDLDTLTLNETHKVTIKFENGSAVDLELTLYEDDTSLRYSLALCEEERLFQAERCLKVFESMQTLLGDDAPRTLKEVPTVAMIFSGGGYRAMVASTGAMKAMSDTKLIDMVQYIGGLSGSSWYLSHLYSHQDWPSRDLSRQQAELKKSIDATHYQQFSPKRFLEAAKYMFAKRQTGQPISFTDFYGHVMMHIIMSDRMDSTLSDFAAKIKNGIAPMPLMTSVHVKETVSAEVFHEWVEFSPYEIGMPKYGIFVKPKVFGAKFNMGRLIREFKEPPLHFLYGMWGSAFAILFKRYLTDNKPATEEKETTQEKRELPKEKPTTKAKRTKEGATGRDEARNSSKGILARSISVIYKRFIKDEKASTEEKETSPGKRKISKEKTNVKRTKGGDSISDTENKSSSSETDSEDEDVNEITPDMQDKMHSDLTEKKAKKTWGEYMLGSKLLNIRSGRAGKIFSFMRGLNMKTVYPFSPFAPSNDETDGKFGGNFEEGIHTDTKKLYMIDSGCAFNTPFPLVLRPQRQVNLIMSFDFSGRECDESDPFGELENAAKWAEINRVPFPKIDVSDADRANPEELYVFRDDNDPACPTVMHFVLINKQFRNFKTPGVPRETDEELKFADFSLFDGPNGGPYYTFNFEYSSEKFDRLSKLVEFNTLLCEERIKNEIARCVRKKKRRTPMRMTSLVDLIKMMPKHLASQVSEDELVLGTDESD